jgi:hypothetical protein
MSDGFSIRSQAGANDELDYERLADLVAQRLRAAGAAPVAAESPEATGRTRKS